MVNLNHNLGPSKVGGPGPFGAADGADIAHRVDALLAPPPLSAGQTPPRHASRGTSLVDLEFELRN